MDSTTSTVIPWMEPPANNQEFYDRTKEYFSRPDARLAFDSIGAKCRYRTDDGCACAVGCNLPDTVYIPQMDGSGGGSIRYILNKTRRSYLFFEQVGIYLENVDTDFAQQIQTAHDSSAATGIENPEMGIELFLTRISNIAEQWKLVP